MPLYYITVYCKAQAQNDSILIFLKRYEFSFKIKRGNRIFRTVEQGGGGKGGNHKARFGQLYQQPVVHAFRRRCRPPCKGLAYERRVSRHRRIRCRAINKNKGKRTPAVAHIFLAADLSAKPAAFCRQRHSTVSRNEPKRRQSRNSVPFIENVDAGIRHGKTCRRLTARRSF